MNDPHRLNIWIVEDNRSLRDTLAELLHFWVERRYPVHIMAGFMVELGMRDKQLQDAINQLDLD